MKRVYERPMMYMEEFVVNKAISVCSEHEVVFDCMMGPNIDTTNVITSSENCLNQAGVANNVTTAIHPASDENSDYTGGTWERSGSSLTYTAPESAEGLLYICAQESGQGYDKETNFTTNEWNVTNSVLVHNSSHSMASGKPKKGGGTTYHCQIAPIYDQSVVSTS